jgi:hypothetical protein
MSRHQFRSSMERNFVELDIDVSRLAGNVNTDFESRHGVAIPKLLSGELRKPAAAQLRKARA